MNATYITERLVDYTIANSGAEQRNYLGMSSISDCPLELYRRMLGQRPWTKAGHLNCYSGYLWERDIKARLQALGLYTPGSERELIAQFDSRFKGHTDGEISGEQSLLEIKSTRQEKLDRIISDRRLPLANFQQVQTYMHHGGYSKTYVVYVARDTGELHVMEVEFKPNVADSLNAKAQRILAAVDNHQPPQCECRKCRQ